MSPIPSSGSETHATGVSVINGKTRMVEAKTINTSNLSVNVTGREFFSYSPAWRGDFLIDAHSGSGLCASLPSWPTGRTLTAFPAYSLSVRR